MGTYTPSTTLSPAYRPDYSPSGDFIVGPTLNTGNLSATLDDVTGDIIGDLPLRATIGVTFDNVTGDIIGDLPLRAMIGATFDNISSTVVGKNVQNLGVLTVTLDGVVAGMIGNYDPNVTRHITALNSAPYEPATKLAGVATCLPVEAGDSTNIEVAASRDSAQQLTDCSELVVEQATETPLTVCSAQDQCGTVADDIAFPYEQGTPTEIELASGHDETASLWAQSCFPYQQATVTNPDKITFDSKDLGEIQHDFLRSLILPPAVEYTPSGEFSLPGGDYTPTTELTLIRGTEVFLAIGHALGIAAGGACSSFQIATTLNEFKRCAVVEETKQPERGVTPWVDLPRDPVDPNPPSGSTIIVPIQDTYIMENTITVTLDDDLTAIQMGKVTLALDADSFTWKFAGDLLNPSDIALVKQLPDGSPIVLHITINSYIWHVIVEKISTNKKFANESVSVSGRGINALLTKPYRQAESVNYGTLQTVQQLADLIIPIGWTNVWSTVTWNVDGGAYSYTNKTPMEALKGIADDIGAIIVPSRTAQSIAFKPRYPVLPWDFAATTADVVLPDSAVIELSEEPVSSYQGNGIYIHGNEIGGELALVRLNGTAGDRLMPTLNNALMTDTIGIRALGERQLAAQAPQPAIKSVKTFMDGTVVPLLEVGSLLETTVDAVGIKGIVNSVSIEASLVDVWQTLTIGETTPNAWVAFTEILPKDPMLVATLTSTDGVTSLMTMLDGGVVRVRGTGTVSNKYYIKSGEISGDAPSITQGADVVL